MVLRRVVVLSFLFLIAFAVHAQFGNEWIKPNQFYFKVPTAKDGIYRISFQTLQTAGFPVDNIDPRRIQLFHRGVEQAIYVDGEADAQFNDVDFIEFYGRRNDGAQDTELYKPATAQPHKYYNLYNDTTSYFITFNPLPIPAKRMSYFSEVNVSNIPKETYQTDEELLILNDTYATGQTYYDYLQSSFFNNGEGWSGADITNGNFKDYVVSNIVNGATGSDVPQVEILLMGQGDYDHEAEIYVGPNAGALRLLTTNDFFGFATSKINLPLNWTDIGADGKINVRIKVNGVNASFDRLNTCYIKISFPQTYNASGLTEKTLTLNVNPSNKSYIELTNPSTGLRLFDITDPDNAGRIQTTLTTTLNAVVPQTNTPRKLIATNVINTPAYVKEVRFRNIIPAAHNYIVISNRVLMRSALGYTDPVRAYAGYRASKAGGSYDTLVVDVNQLYDQFNYGEVSSLAIYHFMKYLCASHVPSYLFIIGKGLTINYNYARNPTSSSFIKYKDLVPAAGIPASDMYYTVGLAGTTNEPGVPTGRITATTPQDVASYLNKVIEMEALPYNDLWRKNLLHLSGGIHEGEPQAFRQFMQDFQKVAEGFYLGGKVKAIAKQTTDIQLINISDEVNKGVNLVTFYGHSAPTVNDFDIGFVTDPVLGYNNKGKYPTLLMNGCNAGSFFLNTALFGEDWINAGNKGAVGFIAHTSYGLEYYLKKYTDTFYAVGYGDSTFIHKGLGDIQKEVAKRYLLSVGGGSEPDVTQVQQMLLLGDPAVKLFGANKPDYEINENSVFIQSFDGTPITALTDSFALRLIVRNFGEAKDNKLSVQIKRTFSNNSTATQQQLFPPVLYTDTLTLIIKKNEAGGFGNTTFEVKVDSDNDIPELNELNNIVSKEILIPLNGTKNLFPPDYAIVGTPTVNLTFQCTDLLSGERDFIVELDTLDSFTSSYKKQFAVKGKVLAKQILPLLTQDTLAYYWRTKLANPLPGESIEWTVSSFTYIANGPEGWAQVHFPQYLKNESIGLVRDATFRKLRFESTTTQIDITTFGAANSATNQNVSLKINNAEYNLYVQSEGCRGNTINLVAFDKSSTVPYAGIPFTLVDPRTCGRAPQVINNFAPSELETVNGGDDMLQVIDNIIAGDSVVLFSIGNAGYASWSANVKNKLAEIGISVAQIDALQDGEPVVIFGKKGIAAGSAVVYKTSTLPANQQALVVKKSITGRYTKGELNSVVIGPAASWKKFINQITDKEPSDQVTFNIVGISIKGKEQLLFSNVNSDMDLSVINAADYPYLRVELQTTDNVLLTPVQLKKWLVLYETVAEGLIVYKGSDEQQLIVEGEIWKGSYAFVNISDKNFTDSLTVQYEVLNKVTRTSLKQNFKIQAPQVNDTTNFTLAIDTHSKSGLNDLNVFVNPHIIAEQYYDNNILNFSDYLNVQGDIYKPVLDVTIDGRLVLDNDFVSPDPFIRVRLWDENHIVLKQDTANVSVLLKYPCADASCDSKRINFSNPDVKWYAATDTSDFQFLFTPHNLPEGVYTLQVLAKDANGNGAGTTPYEVTFKVKYETSIELLTPHPNPSTGNFFFTFIVSGSVTPDNFKLEVVTVEGKTLNELTLNNASFHVGTNEIAWVGKDSYGNDLPGGVYIYKILFTAGDKQVSKNGKLILVK